MFLQTQRLHHGMIKQLSEMETSTLNWTVWRRTSPLWARLDRCPSGLPGYQEVESQKQTIGFEKSLCIFLEKVCSVILFTFDILYIYRISQVYNLAYKRIISIRDFFHLSDKTAGIIWTLFEWTIKKHSAVLRDRYETYSDSLWSTLLVYLAGI